MILFRILTLLVLTGCDTVSSIYGVGKVEAVNVIHHHIVGYIETKLSKGS